MTAPLPELVTVVCPACCGTGVDDYVTVDGRDVAEGCTLCNATGTQEVCSACGEPPCAFSDTCTCNPIDPEVLWAISAGLCSPEQVGL